MDEYGRHSLLAAVCLKACDDYIKAYYDHDEKVMSECVEFFNSHVFRKVTGVTGSVAVEKLQKLPRNAITHIWRKTREDRKYNPKKIIRKHKNRPRAYLEVKSWRNNLPPGSNAAKTFSQKIQGLL